MENKINVSGFKEELMINKFKEGKFNINFLGEVNVSKAYDKEKNITTIKVEKPIKEGDIIVIENNNLPFNTCVKGSYIGRCLAINDKCVFLYYFLDLQTGIFHKNSSKYPALFSQSYFTRFPTEEEIKKLEDKLKEENLEWNSETKKLEPIYVPQYGDIVYIGGTNLLESEKLCIFDRKISSRYKTLFSLDLNIFNVDFGYGYSQSRPIRKATPEECDVVFKQLEKLGKRWNSETKKIEVIQKTECINLDFETLYPKTLEWPKLKDFYFPKDNEKVKIKIMPSPNMGCGCHFSRHYNLVNIDSDINDVIIGELCIFRNYDKKYAVVGILKEIKFNSGFPYITQIGGHAYHNCIKYISKERYEKFLKSPDISDSIEKN